MNTPGRYLSPAQAAKKLNVSPITIRHWCNQGKLSCKKTLGGHRRIPLAQIEQLQAINQSQSTKQHWLLLSTNPQAIQLVKSKQGNEQANIQLTQVDSSFLLGVACTEKKYDRIIIDPALTFENSQYIKQILVTYFNNQTVQVELLRRDDLCR